MYLLTAISTVLIPLCAVPAAQAPTPPPRPAVDLAICLDTSGSMRGLLDAARQGIWAIVNDLATARPTPRLRVALLGFGNDGYRQEDGWVEVLSPLTEDLDEVSRVLFALTTNGGTEYVGRVLARAESELAWSPDPGALKLVVVAGNESADQDQERPFPAACKSLVARGIVVNAIYCGNPADELAPRWREVARLADGEFHAIDHNRQVAIETPFDAQLQALSTSLNQTYVPYGEAGRACWINQSTQDSNAASCNAQTVATRALSKAGKLYVNSHWDLVDAWHTGTVKVEEVKDEDLPEGLRAMTATERTAHLAAKLEQRTALQQQIQAVNRQREDYVRQHAAENDRSRSFDFAVRKAVRAQAEARGLQLPEAGAPLETPAAGGTDDC